MLSFQGRYRQLTEDRLGSRVAETMWDRADGFMKEKMARSLLPEATALANSQYGKYLARKMKLHLLQARPEEWKETVLRVKHHFAHQQVKGQAREQISTNRIEDAPQQVVEATPVFALAEGGGREKGNERKRKMAEVEKDEIDDLFQGVEGKSRKRKEKRERA
jgi:nucleolar protein 9